MVAQKKKTEIKERIELENLRHEHKMKEIEFEAKCKKEIEAIKFDNIMSHHRIKRSDTNRFAMRKDFEYGNKDY